MQPAAEVVGCTAVSLPTVLRLLLLLLLLLLLQDHAVEDWVTHGLNLPQYAGAFRRNAITALDFPLLVADGGAALRSDLGVTSKLHQAQVCMCGWWGVCVGGGTLGGWGGASFVERRLLREVPLGGRSAQYLSPPACTHLGRFPSLARTTDPAGPEAPDPGPGRGAFGAPRPAVRGPEPHRSAATLVAARGHWPPRVPQVCAAAPAPGCCCCGAGKPQRRQQQQQRRCQ